MFDEEYALIKLCIPMLGQIESITRSSASARRAWALLQLFPGPDRPPGEGRCQWMNGAVSNDVYTDYLIVEMQE